MSGAGSMRVLRRDACGAILVMALPMVLLLIGMLHFAVGVGETILRRETMQDAADASAFTAAVMMARGMNLIVLTNIIMAALIAVLVALRLTEYGTLAMIAVCGVLAYPTAGASMSPVPGLSAASRKIHAAYETANGVISPVVSGLHALAQAIKHAMPVAAEARVMETSRHYAPPALIGFAIPNQLALPVEPGTQKQLCDKASDYAGQMALLPLRALMPAVVPEDVLDGFSEAAGSLARHFCTFDAGEPPPIELPARQVVQHLPKLPEQQACEDFGSRDDGTVVDPEHQRICELARQRLEAARPHPIHGGCNADDCSAYHTRNELARSACRPPGRPALSEWVWQEREVTLVGALRPRGQYPAYFEHLEPEHGAPRLRRHRQPPCGAGGTVGGSWNELAAEPLCVEPHEPLHAEGPVRGRQRPAERITYTEVTQVLDCSRSVPAVTVRQTAGASASGQPARATGCNGQSASRVHHNVQACADLGSETFQLRAVVIGQAASTKQRDVIDTMVLRRRGEQAPWAGLDLGDGLQAASRLFVAQSEFYFDADASAGTTDRLEWMWSMDWRARLVRFHLADTLRDRCEEQRDRQRGASASSRCGAPPVAIDAQDACEKALGGETCAKVQAAIENLDQLVVH